jgi:hypothetical protein
MTDKLKKLVRSSLASDLGNVLALTEPTQELVQLLRTMNYDFIPQYSATMHPTTHTDIIQTDVLLWLKVSVYLMPCG